MDTNRYFSFSRLGWVMKRDWMENWKMNLYRFFGSYAAFLLMMIFGYLTEESFEDFAKLVCGVLGFILFFVGTYAASFVMETMDTQEKRIAYLMLPATSLEKFISRVLYVTVGFAGLVVIALLLAEATRFLFFPLFDLPDTFKQSVLPLVWDDLMSMDMLVFEGPGAKEPYLVDKLSNVLGWLLGGWIYSFFILGGCYWHKHAFEKTLGIMLAVGIVGVMALVFVVAEGVDETWWLEFAAWSEEYFNWLTITSMLSLLIWVFVGLILLNWWLAYRCFAHSQIVKPKFSLL